MSNAMIAMTTSSSMSVNALFRLSTTTSIRQRVNVPRTAIQAEECIKTQTCVQYGTGAPRLERVIHRLSLFLFA